MIYKYLIAQVKNKANTNRVLSHSKIWEVCENPIYIYRGSKMDPIINDDHRIDSL